MNGYGTVFDTGKISVASGSGTLTFGKFTAEQRWDIDEIDLNVGAVNGGFIRIGYGDNANNPSVYETDAVTDGMPIKFKNLGFSNTDGGQSGIYYEGTGSVNFNATVGAHMVKQTKKKWIKCCATTPFAGRLGGQAISYGGKLLFMGGRDATTVYNDVWQSSDNGETWTEITGTPFTARFEFGLVELNDILYVIAGHDDVNGTSSLNDVWSSPDGGITWTIIQPSAAFTAFGSGVAVVLGSLMYVYSGVNGSTNIQSQKVWSSPDGITWTETQSSVPWPKRRLANGLNWNNKMWLIGGRNNAGELSDVWSSTDGNQWIESKQPLPFPGRYSFGVQSFNQNRNVYLYGGLANAGSRNDVWKTPDNGFWYEENDAADFSVRAGFGSAFHNGSLFVISGYLPASTFYAEVWRTNVEKM